MTAPTPEAIRAADHERLLAALLAPGRGRRRGSRAGRAPARRAIARGYRRRPGPRAPRAPAGARGSGRRRATAPRRARSTAIAPASRTSSGSRWTSAAATMPTRAGCCPCCAAAATSPATRSARSASPPNETRFADSARARPRFADAVKRTADGEGEGEVTIDRRRRPARDRSTAATVAPISAPTSARVRTPRPAHRPRPAFGPAAGACDDQALCVASPRARARRARPISISPSHRRDAV